MTTLRPLGLSWTGCGSSALLLLPLPNGRGVARDCWSASGTTLKSWSRKSSFPRSLFCQNGLNLCSWNILLFVLGCPSSLDSAFGGLRLLMIIMGKGSVSSLNQMHTENTTWFANTLIVARASPKEQLWGRWEEGDQSFSSNKHRVLGAMTHYLTWSFAGWKITY